MDPLEQVGNTTNTANTDNIVPPSQTTSVLSDEHPTELKVTSDLLLENVLNEISTDTSGSLFYRPNDMPNVELRSIYDLSPRSTRGVLPR